VPATTAAGTALTANGLALSPRIAETNSSNLIGSYTTWIYTGQVFIPSSNAAAFAGTFDDTIFMRIDGTTRLQDFSSYQRATSTATTTGFNGTTTFNGASTGATTNFGAGVGGWHDIEIRFGNVAGNGGANGNAGWNATLGFGYTTDVTTTAGGVTTASGAYASNYIRALDAGDASLFRSVFSNSLTKTGSGTLTLGGNNTYQGATTINEGAVIVAPAGAIGNGNITVNAGATMTVTGITGTGDVTVNGNLTVTGAGNMGFAAATVNAGGLMTVDGIAVGSGSGNCTINVAGGVLTGVGTFNGDIAVSAGSLLGGNSPVGLKVGGNTAFSGTGAMQVNVAGTGGNATYSQLVVNTGTLNLNGATLNASDIDIATVGDRYSIVKNNAGTISGQFNGLANGMAVAVGGGQYMRVLYYSNEVVLLKMAPATVNLVGSVLHTSGDAIAAGLDNRSVVSEIVVKFDGIVDSLNLGTGTTLQARSRQAGNNVSMNATRVVSESPGDVFTTTFTIHFGNSGASTYLRGPLGNQVYSLQDDNYAFKINAAGINVGGGSSLAGNVVDNFFRYFGDTDVVSYGTVDAVDLTRFRMALLNNPSALPQWDSWFDLNGDGNLTQTPDYDQMRLNYARRLPDHPG